MAVDSPKNDFVEKHRWLTYADEPDTVYDGSKILDGSITTEKLADYAVTTDKIDDESITMSKLDTDVLNLLEGNVRAFGTVADMRAATLEAGDVCHTNGFYTAGDGGAAFYKVTASGTENGMDVLACGDVFANLVIESVLNVLSLGAQRNEDLKPYIDRFVAVSDMVEATLYIPAGRWVTSPINISNKPITIKGASQSFGLSSNSTVLCAIGEQTHVLKIGDTSSDITQYVTIENIGFSGSIVGDTSDISAVDALLVLEYVSNSVFKNLCFNRFLGSAMTLSDVWECQFGVITCSWGGDFSKSKILFKDTPHGNFSALYFDSFYFETINGSCIELSADADLSNSVINNIFFEDRLAAIGGISTSVYSGETITNKIDAISIKTNKNSLVIGNLNAQNFGHEIGTDADSNIYQNTHLIGGSWGHISIGNLTCNVSSSNVSKFFGYTGSNANTKATLSIDSVVLDGYDIFDIAPTTAIRSVALPNEMLACIDGKPAVMFPSTGTYNAITHNDNSIIPCKLSVTRTSTAGAGAVISQCKTASGKSIKAQCVVTNGAAGSVNLTPGVDGTAVTAVSVAAGYSGWVETIALNPTQKIDMRMAAGGVGLMFLDVIKIINAS